LAFIASAALLFVHRRNWQRLKYEPSTPNAGRKDFCEAFFRKPFAEQKV